MLADTHTRRVLELASQKGLLRASDLDAINAPRVVLTRLIATGVLDRVGRRDRFFKTSVLSQTALRSGAQESSAKLRSSFVRPIRLIEIGRASCRERV